MQLNKFNLISQNLSKLLPYTIGSIYSINLAYKLAREIYSFHQTIEFFIIKYFLLSFDQVLLLNLAYFLIGRWEEPAT